MRNFNSKSHIKPATHNSFKKDNRNYPQPKKVSIKTSGIDTKIPQKILNSTKNRTQMVNEEVPIQLPMYTTPPRIQSISEKISQKYFLNLQDAYEMFDRRSNVFDIDNQCLWYRNIDKFPRGKSRSISISQLRYQISDWAQDQFPDMFFLCIDGINGYLNQQGVVTSRVAALHPVQMTPFQKNGVYVYELLYKGSDEGVQWQIPSDMTHIKLYMQDDNSQTITTPLLAPLKMELTIKNQV